MHLLIKEADFVVGVPSDPRQLLSSSSLLAFSCILSRVCKRIDNKIALEYLKILKARPRLIVL